MPRCQNLSLLTFFQNLKNFCIGTKGYYFKLCKKCCVFLWDTQYMTTEKTVTLMVITRYNPHTK